MRLVHATDPAVRPDFAALLYTSTRGVELGPPEGSGPLFLAAASDDQLGLAPDSLRPFECWHQAGLPVELHLYAQGGHGFGMRSRGLPSDTWIDRFGDSVSSFPTMQKVCLWARSSGPTSRSARRACSARSAVM